MQRYQVFEHLIHLLKEEHPHNKVPSHLYSRSLWIVQLKGLKTEKLKGNYLGFLNREDQVLPLKRLIQQAKKEKRQSKEGYRSKLFFSVLATNIFSIQTEKFCGSFSATFCDFFRKYQRNSQVLRLFRQKAQRIFLKGHKQKEAPQTKTSPQQKTYSKQPRSQSLFA